MKLQSIKSEIRYTPNMILVKLVGSHSISQIQLRISDIKRTKMVSLPIQDRRWVGKEGTLTVQGRKGLLLGCRGQHYSSPATGNVSFNVIVTLNCPAPFFVYERSGPQQGDRALGFFKPISFFYCRFELWMCTTATVQCRMSLSWRTSKIGRYGTAIILLIFYSCVTADVACG